MNMVFNSALCFLSAGLALLLPHWFMDYQKQIYLSLGFLICLISGLTLSQDIFHYSLPIDQLFVGAWMDDMNPHPGRMAINTAMAFLLSGVTFILFTHIKRQSTVWIIKGAIFIIFFLGLITLLGHSLTLDFLYSWYNRAHMTIITATDFIILSLGLGAVLVENKDSWLFNKSREDVKIILPSIIILFSVASIAGLVGFATSANRNEITLRNNLEQSIQSKMNIFREAIKRPLLEIGTIQRNQFLRHIILNTEWRNSKSSFDNIEKLLLTTSFSALQIRDIKDHLIYISDNFTTKPDVIMPLNLPNQAKLIWKDGFALELAIDLMKDHRKIGTFIAQWPLNAINPLFNTNESYICANSNSQLNCLPRESGSTKFSLFSTQKTQKVFDSAVLEEQKTIITGIDNNNRMIMAIYNPIDNLGIGFIVREYLADIYQPLRKQLQIVIPILILTIGIGLLLLYWQVLPLIRQVIRSKKKALESRAHLKSLVDHIEEGIINFNENGIIEHFNQRASTIFNISINDALGNSIASLLPSIKTGDSNYIHHGFSQWKGKKYIETIGLKKSDRFPIELSITDIYVKKRHSYMAIVRDITERKAIQSQLQENEQRFGMAFDSAATGMALISLEGQWIRINPALCNILGYNESELLSLDLHQITHPDDIKLSDEQRHQLLSGEAKNLQLECRYYRKNGSFLWTLTNIAMVYDLEQKPLYFIAQIQDISDKKKSEEMLSHLAYYDALTGLANRAYLEYSLEKEISTALRHQHKFAIFFLDLDKFKKINDSLGHDIGDELLKIVSSRLKNCIRKTDIAARLGGDEFILILQGLDQPERAATFAEKIITAISRPIVIKEHEIYTSTSIGISFYPLNGSDYNTLIKSADMALYQAKENGRNVYRFCTPEMNHEIQEKVNFKNELKKALDNNEFSLHFQPKLDVAGNEVAGFEALLRWDACKQGAVDPQKLIALAEESGLIIPLSNWVIKSACFEARRWQNKMKANFILSINVSARQFKQSNFTDVVFQALRETQFDTHYLELEISESLIMQDPENSLKIIKTLREAGVNVAIDNFGTGYSSINYLHQFSVSHVKIDKTFIQHCAIDARESALVTAMIHLAKSLGIKVIAEGVETKAQFDFLLREGCDEIQGYYFSRPLSSKQVLEFLNKFYSETIV